MITAEIIADSINPRGVRLTSWLLTYPRFIHAEFMTHRSFSRNAASSRAIPIKKMIEDVEQNPAWPEYWGANQSGMQSRSPLSPMAQDACRARLDRLRHEAAHAVEDVSFWSLHKQIANRYIEPWAHITVLATATDAGLGNFFALRAHPDAQPEIQVLAYRMLAKYLAAEPALLEWGEWHIPFGDRMPEPLSEWDQIAVATARAARISYKTFDGEIDVAKDLELHDRLAKSGHWSPFEHCAEATPDSDPERFSNFDFGGSASGWRQYRKLFEGEMKEPDLQEVLASKPDWVTIE